MDQEYTLFKLNINRQKFEGDVMLTRHSNKDSVYLSYGMSYGLFLLVKFCEFEYVWTDRFTVDL